MNIVVYGKDTDPTSPNYCVHCANAKALLEVNGIPYEYHNITDDSFDIVILTTIIAPGAKSVPIIVVNDQWIGGFSELSKLIAILAKRQNIEEIAQSHAVQVVFTKENGEERTLIGTLNPQRLQDILGKDLPGITGLEPKEPNLSVLPVVDVEKRAWRSIPLARVISYQSVA